MSDSQIRRAIGKYSKVVYHGSHRTITPLGRPRRSAEALEYQSWHKKVAKGRKATKAGRLARKLNRK